MLIIPLFRIAHVVIDLALILVVYIVVFLLRFDGLIPKAEQEVFWFFMPIIPAIRLTSNYVLGLYSHLWKYVGMRELISIVKSATLGSLVFVLVVFLTRHTTFSRSIFIIEWALFLLAVGGVRFSRRFSREVAFSKSGHYRQRTLIIGAGDAGAMVASEMLRYRDQGLIPVGFIDDDPQKWKAKIHELRVFGSRDKIQEVILNHEVDLVVIAMPSISRKVIKEFVDLCTPTDVRIQIVPATHQILKGEVKINQIRHLQIEDLLGREPVVIDDNELKPFLLDKSVLVTGAGGSIGRELCLQILSYQPKTLFVLGHGENSIYQLIQSLKGFEAEIIPIISDVREEFYLSQLFNNINIDVIYHTAAHKHVPLMERNTFEAFLNNVLGTHSLIKAAIKSNIKQFTLISTDKSTHPTSIMGLTKYFSELVVQKASIDNDCKFNCVRFGNVIGSRGSVIPLFQKQIEMGGPITVTDPRMTRYFMTIPEAVQLVLQASILGKNKDTFILDMGEPIGILDLAQNLIRLSGYQLDEIEIKMSGVREGEKLHEQLVWEDEELSKTNCTQILKAFSHSERISEHLSILDELLPLLSEKNQSKFNELYKNKLIHIK